VCVCACVRVCVCMCVSLFVWTCAHLCELFQSYRVHGNKGKPYIRMSHWHNNVQVVGDQRSPLRANRGKRSLKHIEQDRKENQSGHNTCLRAELIFLSFKRLLNRYKQRTWGNFLLVCVYICTAGAAHAQKIHCRLVWLTGSRP